MNNLFVWALMRLSEACCERRQTEGILYSVFVCLSEALLAAIYFRTGTFFSKAGELSVLRARAVITGQSLTPGRRPSAFYHGYKAADWPKEGRRKERKQREERRTAGGWPSADTS